MAQLNLAHRVLFFYAALNDGCLHGVEDEQYRLIGDILGADADEVRSAHYELKHLGYLGRSDVEDAEGVKTQ